MFHQQNNGSVGYFENIKEPIQVPNKISYVRFRFYDLVDSLFDIESKEVEKEIDNGNLLLIDGVVYPCYYGVINEDKQSITIKSYDCVESLWITCIVNIINKNEDGSYLVENINSISSCYWFGEDNDGKYIIRKSNHWCSFKFKENYNQINSEIVECKYIGKSKWYLMNIDSSKTGNINIGKIYEKNLTFNK